MEDWLSMSPWLLLTAVFPVPSIVAGHSRLTVDVSEWIMKHDFKVIELLSSHHSVAFKIRGIGFKIPALPLTLGVLT